MSGWKLLLNFTIETCLASGEWEGNVDRMSNNESQRFLGKRKYVQCVENSSPTPNNRDFSQKLPLKTPQFPSTEILQEYFIQEFSAAFSALHNNTWSVFNWPNSFLTLPLSRFVSPFRHSIHPVIVFISLKLLHVILMCHSCHIFKLLIRLKF